MLLPFGKRSMERKDSLITMKGQITSMLSNARFYVLLENGVTINAYICGKMRRNRIRVILNDRVLTELSVYDLTRGRIIYRYRRLKKSKPTLKKPSSRPK